MKQLIQPSRCPARAFLTALVIGLACRGANAQVTILGAQYHPDQMFPFGCYWNPDAYPNCPTIVGGATVHVYIKNTGASAVTINDATLAGYSLTTVIKTETGSGLGFASIYFYWGQNPPADILAAGEPVWYIANPTSVPAGGVGQVTVRLRNVPTTPTLTVGAVTSAGTVTTNITVDANAPQVANIAYSDDLTKVYLQWRRSGGAAPASVWMDGVNVTANTTTVGDTNVDFGASVISLANALPFFSGHVYQGVYADGTTATAWQHAWTNKFIYCTYGTFAVNGDGSGASFMAAASAHGFNSVQYVLGDLGSYMGHNTGCNDALARGYGYTIMNKSQLNGCMDPEMWLLRGGDAEPDDTEYNRTTSGNSPGCGTGNKIPCGYAHSPGVWVQTLCTATNAALLAADGPNVPITANVDAGFDPWDFYHYGPALDILESDNYYDVRLRNAYWYAPNRIPVDGQAKLSYAVARSATAAAEPNPFVHLLYSCKYKDTSTGNIWPFPFPESKHMEAYYSLAGGTKGMGYWWLADSPAYPSYGLTGSSECAPLWKEMGLIGNEIKTARPLIIRSTPVDLTISPNSTNIWVRAQASGTDALLLYVVNDDYYNDEAGCHYTDVANTIITNTLPSWLVSTNTTVFQITTGGRPGDASFSVTGSQLVLYMGTLHLVHLYVITTNTTLRSTIQSQYDSAVKANLCTFASEYCQSPPSITQQPAGTTLCPGGTATFSVAATTTGPDPVTYQWQQNGINLGDGGEFSGSATATLTVSPAGANDAGNYRCVASNLGGGSNSSPAALTVRTATGFTQPPSAANVFPGANATFSVVATGDGTITYQWQTNGVNLSNNNHYGGCTTPSLTVTNCSGADAVNYDCVATAGCGSATSVPAALTVGTTITGQPSPQNVCAGANASFSVTASGGCTLAYQWQTNGVNLNNNSHYGGCTTATLTVTNVGSADAVNYDCVAAGSCGNATSSAAALTLGAATTITGQPSSQTVNSGGTALFSITATGNGALAYQWQTNGVNINNSSHYGGCTTASLTVTNVGSADAVNYDCVVTGCGSAASSPATLTVNTCTLGTLGLLNGNFEDWSDGSSVAANWSSYGAGNGTATFWEDNTTIHGGLAAEYVQNKNGGAGSLLGVFQNMPAHVGDAFTFSGWVYPQSAPTYQQVAMVVRWDGSTATPATGSGAWNISTGARQVWTQLQNLAGNATSTSVTLFLDSRRISSSIDISADWDDVVCYPAFVPPAPVVSSAGGTSLNVNVLPGCNWTNGSAQYAITIGGGAYTLGANWVQANGSVGTTAVWQTDAAWAATTVTGLTTGTPYTFEVQARYSSTYPQATSLGAGATGTPVASPPPSITQQPSAQNLCPGGTAVFNVTASGSGTITYQWQKSDANLSDGGHYSGSATPTLTVSNAASGDVANYRCRVSNAGGSTNSSEASLTLKAATAITGNPAGQKVSPGANAAFSVTATGDGTLTYQWQTNGASINNGSHYGGCTTATLTVTNAGSADAVNYACVVTGGCGSATSSAAPLTLTTNAFGSITLGSIPTLSGDTTNDARAITPDGQWVVGVSGARGFLYNVNTTNIVNVVSSDGAQSTILAGVGCRTNGSQQQIVLSGLSSGWFTAWMTTNGGATWGAKVQANSGVKPTVPVANGLAGTASDVFYSVWTDEGPGPSDNWGLNVGRFSNTWPASVAWGPKSAAKPDTLQLNAISGNGRGVGWRQNGTTLVYANYVADWQGVATPAIWNFNGLGGTTAGQAYSVSADGTIIFGISPKGAATGTTNYGYKAVFNAAMPGPATQLSTNPLPNFPDTAGATNLAVPYGCTPDGKYAVGMSYRGLEKAVLWDTSNPNPARWTVVDLTDVAAANGILNGFARLSRAYSVGTNAAGALVIAGVGLDTSSPANTRAFWMTVSPPIAPIAFPPTVTISSLYPGWFTCSFLSLANPSIICSLECATNLAPPATWTTITSTPSTGGLTSLSDPNPPDRQRFYRIRIQ